MKKAVNFVTSALRNASLVSSSSAVNRTFCPSSICIGNLSTRGDIVPILNWNVRQHASDALQYRASTNSAISSRPVVVVCALEPAFVPAGLPVALEPPSGAVGADKVCSTKSS